MSSQNSSNDEFENLDEMLSDADGASLETGSDNPFGDANFAENFQTNDSSETAEYPSLDYNMDSVVSDGEVSYTEETSPETTSNEAIEEQSVQYKKVHCWDMYSILLFVAWLALLGGIAILYFECPPNEYGNPPYKESSTPVKTVQQ